MVEAFRKMLKERRIKKIPIKDSVAAISVGKVEGSIVLDLNYEEDSRAEVDMNVVMTGLGGFVEIQGTAEGAVFSKQEMDDLVRLARKGIRELTKIQKKVLSLPPLPTERRGRE
jgi:ribonuclease PH